MKTAKLLTIFFVLVALMLTAKAALGADTDIVINEIMVNPSTGSEWVELYNTGESGDPSVDITGWFIRTNTGDTPLTGILSGGNLLVIELDDQIADLGDKVVLKNLPSGFIDALTFGEYSNVNIPEHIDDTPGEDEVLARIHDGEDWLEEAHSEDTKNSANNRMPFAADEFPVPQLREVIEETVYFDLADYFFDLDDIDDLTYTKVSQSGGMLCNIQGTDNDELRIRLGANWQEEGGCKIAVTDGYKTIENTISVTVTPALEITVVKVNGITVQEGEETTELMPLEEITAQVTIKNNLNYWITNVNAVLSNSEFILEGPYSININGGETKTITATGIVPETAQSGVYGSEIIVTGKDYYTKEELDDLFSFNAAIYQNPSELFISGLKLNQEELTCRAKTILTVDLINTGMNDEDDAVVTIKVGGEEYSKDLSVVTANGGQGQVKFSIFAEDLSQGNNQILVEVSYRNDLNKDSDSIVISKEQCILSWLPEEDAFIMSQTTDVLSVILNEEVYNSQVKWYVNNVLQTPADGANENEFEFTPWEVGDYEVYATIAGEFTQTWDYYITNVPYSENGLVPEGYFEGKDTSDLADFTLENNNGKIVFNTNVDVSGILDLDEVITISNGLVGIDTAVDAAPELDTEATITIKKYFTNYLILKAEGFGSNVGEFVPCGVDCEFVSNSNGNFVFTVTGFSTYKVVEQLPADILINGLTISDVNRGESVTKQITFTNTGSYQDLTGIVVGLINVDADYNPVLTGVVPTTLSSGASFILTLTLDVPADADGGDNVIGKISFVSNELDTIEQSVVVSPMSYLSIESIKINGKSSGDLSVEKTNEIEINIENKYSEDMNDVQVTVEILDVNGDDLEEESDEKDINDGKDDDFVVEFDLDSSEMDEDSYTIRITVVGEADDDTQHETVETKVVDLSREKHKIIINKASLSSSELQCLRQTTLQVDVENIGKENEDDVEIRVKNEELGLSLSRTNLELDDYSNGDNDYRATFTLNLEDAKEGSYQITVGVYRDGDLEEEEEITIEIKDCYTSSTTSQSTSTYVDEKALAIQLQQQLAAKKNLDVQGVSSFRDTNTYTTLLVTLVILMLIVVVLALAVSAKKPKRRR